MHWYDVIYIAFVGGGGLSCLLYARSRKIRMLSESRISEGLKLYLEKENHHEEN